MNYAESTAVRLIERELSRMSQSTMPSSDRWYAVGMIELAYAAELINCEQYRHFSDQIHTLADERAAELRKAA